MHCYYLIVQNNLENAISRILELHSKSLICLRYFHCNQLETFFFFVIQGQVCKKIGGESFALPQSKPYHKRYLCLPHYISSWEVHQHYSDDNSPKAHKRCSALIEMTTLISEEQNIKGTYVSSSTQYNHQPRGTDGSPMAVK